MWNWRAQLKVISAIRVCILHMLASFMMIQIIAVGELYMNSIVVKIENNCINLNLRKCI